MDRLFPWDFNGGKGTENPRRILKSVRDDGSERVGEDPGGGAIRPDTSYPQDKSKSVAVPVGSH